MAMQQANIDDQQYLQNLYVDKTLPDAQLIDETIAIFKKYQIDEITRDKIAFYTKASLEALNRTNLPDKEKLFWQKFAHNLMHRAS